MKPIKRQWTYDSDITNTIHDEALFIVTGQWHDGHLAYSMLDENGEIIPEHEGSFYQVRYNGRLLMVRI